MTDTRACSHLSIRRTKGGGVSAMLTFPDGHEIDLGAIALSDGFAITGLDDPIETRAITLSCKLVVTDLDIDVDVLRARMVDADGEDVSLDELAAAVNGGGDQ